MNSPLHARLRRLEHHAGAATVTLTDLLREAERRHEGQAPDTALAARLELQTAAAAPGSLLAILAAARGRA